MKSSHIDNPLYSRLAMPTTYSGVNFRSRLEAKWAAFFDIVGWTWEYEPATEFRGWIPDFRLLGAERDVFCEVKPVESRDDALWFEAASKIMASGVVAAGREPVILGSWPIGDQLGWICQWWGDQNPEDRIVEWADWLPACFGCWTDGRGKLGFCAGDEGIYKDRISGGYDGGHYGNLNAGRIEPMVRAAWLQAGNAVQWKPGQ